MSRSVAVPRAVLERLADGTPFSPAFQDVYHSVHGGLEQARHVFLQGNGLPQRWASLDRFVVLETGFGLGLNFLAAWDAWRADARRPRRLHFVSVEGSPLSREDLAAALAPFTPLAELAGALVSAWPPPLAGFHRIAFDSGRVVLTLLLGEAQEMLPQLVARVDAFFLDGFSPSRNPAPWSPGVVRELARLAAPGATLATWTVAGGVRAALADAGFEIEKRAGFASKREMLTGRFALARGAVSPRERHALVVGGGLAGTLVAERLAAHEWFVDVLDERPGREAAAIGLLRPVVNLRDALNARISRCAFLFALQHYRALQLDGYHLEWERCGVLQLAAGADEAARFEAIVSSQEHPPEFLEFVDAGRAAHLAGHAGRGAGWWFPSGAAVPPGSLGVASFAKAGERVRKRQGARVDRIEREGRAWRALDSQGRVLGEADTLVLANAADAKRLLPEARLALTAVRGQVTYLPPDPSRRLAVIVSGSGYAAPLPDGGQCIGATYQHDDGDPAVREADHLENLARVRTMMPGFGDGIDAAGLAGWTGFRATVPDRLPVFGASEIEGVHLATGLGSRGLLWAPLGAELLACALDDAPLPLARDHAGAISPRRFLS